jgi:hypothetical protein
VSADRGMSMFCEAPAHLQLRCGRTVRFRVGRWGLHHYRVDRTAGVVAAAASTLQAAVRRQQHLHADAHGSILVVTGTWLECEHQSTCRGISEAYDVQSHQRAAGTKSTDIVVTVVRSTAIRWSP